MALDLLNYFWNRSVISYDFEQQVNIARQVGSRLQGINPSKILQSLVPYLAGIILFALLLFAVRRTSILHTREQRVLRRFLEIVEREFSISTVEGGVGLFEIASLADNRLVSSFVDIYAGAVYHDRRLTNDEYLTLKQILLSLNSFGSKIS
jgi:hypothetical protein